VNTVGLFCFALGGALLLFSFYAIIQGAQSPYLSMGPLIYGVTFGFTAFLLIGIGLFLIIESAMALKKIK